MLEKDKSWRERNSAWVCSGTFCIFILEYLYHVYKGPMPRLWGQLNLISKPNTHMSVYTGVLFHTFGTFIFFTSEQRLFLLILMNWLSESPWNNQLIMYILTYLEGLMKTTVCRQIYNIQNTWHEGMSSEAKKGTGRLHALLSFLLWEVQKFNDSKKPSSWVCVGGVRTYVLIIIYHKLVRLLLLDQRKILLYCNLDGVSSYHISFYVCKNECITV